MQKGRFIAADSWQENMPKSTLHVQIYSAAHDVKSPWLSFSFNLKPANSREGQRPYLSTEPIDRPSGFKFVIG